jgi:DNA-binding transcriptional ArsR family regulator
MEDNFTRKGGKPLRNFTIALTKAQAEAYAERLAILRSPTRQRIIALLEKYPDRQLCVFEIADVLEISFGAISYHLAMLRQARLVSVERYKMYLYYQLDSQRLADYREAARLVGEPATNETEAARP